jgi:hypothetical protein
MSKIDHKQREDGIPEWHPRFMAIAPAIRRAARWYFRRLDPEHREEMVAQVVASALAAFVRLVERGREELAFPSTLARFAIAQARQGRQVGTKLNVRDISSEYCRRRKSIQIQRLHQFDETDGEWREAMVECRKAGPFETAAGRLDFAAWLAGMSSLRRKIAKFLAMGESTADAARTFAISPGRVSQLRREFQASWRAFRGDPIAA